MFLSVVAVLIYILTNKIQKFLSSTFSHVSLFFMRATLGISLILSPKAGIF